MMINYRGRDERRYRNEDLPWLITSQRQYELDELVKIYRSISPKYVLEIGTQEGGTLYQWIKHAPAGAKIVNIDILQGRDEGLIDRWHAWKRPDIELVTIIDYSQKVSHRVRAEMPAIDFLFIDGDHSYEGAKLDFELYGPMVRKGGVIAFHDLMTPKGGRQEHIQIGRLWQEIQHAGYWTREIWASEDPAWGGIGVLYVQAQAQSEGHARRDIQGRVEAFQPTWQSRHLPRVRKEENPQGAAA